MSSIIKKTNSLFTIYFTYSPKYLSETCDEKLGKKQAVNKRIDQTQSLPLMDKIGHGVKTVECIDKFYFVVTFW